MGSIERARALGLVAGRGLHLAGALRVAVALTLLLSAIVAQVTWSGPGDRAVAGSEPRQSGSLARPIAGAVPPVSFRTADAVPAGSGTLALDPDAGPPGTSVLIGGGGFAPGSVVVLTYVDPVQSETQVISATVAADGSLPQSSFLIPQDAAPGSLGHLIASIGSAVVASSLFGVTPFTQALDVSNNVTAPGGALQISASGFAANSPVIVSICDAAGTQTVQSQPITTTSAGVIPPTSVSLPDAIANGVASINVVDASGNVAGVPLTVAAETSTTAVHLSPDVAALGETVMLAAGGFTPNEPVQVYVEDAGTTQTELSEPADLHADATGALSTTFALPLDDQLFANPPSGRSQDSGANAGSLLEILAKGTSSGETLVTPLMVPGTALSINPGQVARHHPTVISGKGYYARESITVSAVGDNGAITELGAATASAAGAFSLSVIAPSPSTTGANGTAFTVSATGEASDLVAASTLTVVAPANLAFTQYVVASGQTTTLQGTGFAASSPITITVQASWSSGETGNPATATGLHVTTDLQGSFSLDVAPPANAADGSATYRAVDAAGHSANGVLTIANFPASLRLSGISAGTGAAITVEGTGFAAGETVDLYLAPPSIPVRPLASTMRPVVADARGTFVAEFPLPTFPAVGI